MRVSVVVPTRDRPAKLEKCLSALRDQDDVVVVDDGSRQAGLVAEIVAGMGARLARLEGRGPAAARNAGAAAAAGAVVCFTDDDCEPTEGWVEALTAPILAREAECAAGRTMVATDASAADRSWQAIADHLQRWASRPGSPSPGFAPTCNLACARSLLEELPFDESFPAAAGEDRDWSARAFERGASTRFVPEALVIHRPGLSARSFLRQQYGYGRGATRYRSAAPGRRPGPPSFYAGLLRAGFAAGPGPGALVGAAQLAAAAGILSARAEAPRPARRDRRR